MLVVIGIDGRLLNHGIASLHFVPLAMTAHCPCEADVPTSVGTNDEAIPNFGLRVVIGIDGCVLNHGIAALHFVPLAMTTQCPCEAGVPTSVRTNNEAIPNFGLRVVIGIDGSVLIDGIASLHFVPLAMTTHCPCEAGVTMTIGTANEAIPNLGTRVVIGIDGCVLIKGIASSLHAVAPRKDNAKTTQCPCEAGVPLEKGLKDAQEFNVS